jgi:O-antigen/teichoic acid export membrane protein
MFRPLHSMTSMSLGRPTLILLLGRTAGYGLALVNSILLARALGAVRLGEYAYAMGLAGLFALLPNLGINPFVTRAVAAHPEREGAIFPIALRAQALLATLVVCAIPVFAALLPAQPIPLIYVILAAAQLGLGTLGWPYLAVLAGRADFTTVAAIELAGALLGTVCLVGALILASGVPGVLAAHVVAAGTATLVARAFTRPARPLLDRPAMRIRDLLRQAAPFGAIAVAQSTYTRLDVLLLGQLATSRAVGLYSVAYKAPNLLTYVGSTVVGPLFPLMAQTGRTESPVAFQRAVRFLGVMGPAVALALSGLAVPILRILYGAEYESAAPLLVLLAWSAAANWLYAPLAVALQARGCEVWWLRSLIGALLVNAAGNLWMIPRWGAMGAAIATLLSELALVAIGASLVAWRFGIRPSLRAAAGGLAAATAGYAVLQFGGGGLPGTTGALAVYFAPLVLLRIVTAEDGRLVLGWIREIVPRAARA